MSITITVNQTEASPGNGVLLRIRQFTRHSPALGGATASANGAYETSITTTVAGSQVVGAVVNEASATAFTADAQSTFYDNFSDATNARQYGTLHGTSVTGTPGATNFGATNVAGAGGIALYEILAGPSALVENGLSLGAFTATGAHSVTSSAFSPQSGSLLVALVALNGSAANANVVTVTDSSGLVWTQQASHVNAAGGYAGVWTAQVPPVIANLIRQPSFSPRWLPQASFKRGRRIEPGWPQGNQGVQFPLWTREPGYSPRWAPQARYSRGRFFPPGWGQANQGAPWPSVTRQPGPSPKWLPHAIRMRGRRSEPGWGQANKGQAWPSVTSQPSWHPRWIPFTRLVHGRLFQPGWGQASQGVQFPLWHRQPEYSPKWAPHVLRIRTRRAEPGWGQGNQGTPFPLALRQPGWKPRWAPHVLRMRGRRSEPGWPQGATGTSLSQGIRSPG